MELADYRQEWKRKRQRGIGMVELKRSFGLTKVAGSKVKPNALQQQRTIVRQP
jgi:hypothetical protein